MTLEDEHSEHGHDHEGHAHVRHEPPGEHDHDEHPGGTEAAHDHSGRDHDHADHDQEAHAGHDHVAYPDAVANYRAEKDEYFRNAHDSPIPAAERESFGGLPYFPVDEALRFEGLTLEPYTGSEPAQFQIPTSDGRLRDAERAGVFTFDLGGGPQRLTGYTFAGGDSESLFVPFLDLTSGRESYGAGRYLDLYPEPDGTYALDFNLAYHPSCVYDAKYSCPLTPAENRLPLRVEAGERLAEPTS